MSKNVSILEGSKAKSVNTVSRLVTDLQGGGVATWVPEDERIIRQKFISKNGSYLAEADSVYGFSKITVNVAGGAAGYTAPTITDDEYGPLTPDPIATPELIPPVAGGIGSSVIGTDPITGNKYVATVGPNGTIEKKKIPSAIRVLMPPAKTKYVDGEKINYSGLMIELLDGEGNHFENSDFPTGTLLWGAPYLINGDTSKDYGVITTVEYASIGDGIATATSDLDTSAWGDVIVRRPTYQQGWYNHGREAWWVYTYSCDGNIKISIFCNDEGGDFVIIASDQSSGTRKRDYYEDSTLKSSRVDTFNFDYTFTHDSKTVHYTVTDGRPYATSFAKKLIDPYVHTTDEERTAVFRNTAVKTNVAWTILYGERSSGSGVIPVKWLSPYDNVEYEDTFEINVDSSMPTDDGFEGSGGGEF